MTALPSVIAGAGADVVATGNFEAVSPAGMYGRRLSTSSGLTWGYFGGQFGPGVAIPDGTVVVGASTTTYVVGDRSTGVVTSSTGTTNWNNDTAYFRIALLVSDASAITNNSGKGVDHRPSIYNAAGGGGGGGTVDTVVAGVGIDVDSTDPANPEVSLDSASQASLALADTAVQPGDLAAVATSGDAADVSIVDAGGYFTSTDVEGALQELGAGGGGGGFANPMTTAGDMIYGGVSGTPTRLPGGSNRQVLAYDTGSSTPGWVTLPLQTLAIAASDLVTNISTGTGKAYFYAPYDFAVAEVQASLDTPQSAGSIFTVDVNKNGTTILSTKVTIDNTEGSSITAATPPVISTALLTKGDKITVDVDQIGTAGAKGLIVYLVGRPN